MLTSALVREDFFSTSDGPHPDKTKIHSNITIFFIAAGSLNQNFSAYFTGANLKEWNL
jgi:hypothetical protein